MKKTFCLLNIFFQIVIVGFVQAATFTGPFRGEALAFFFVHAGGPLRLQSEVIGDQTEAVVRIFDAEENLCVWRYCRPQAGGHQLSHDFGPAAPAGIYQLRVSGRNYQINPTAEPSLPFGVMPARCRLQATATEQFADTWFLLPANAGRFAWNAIGSQPLIWNAAGEPVTVDRPPLSVEAYRGEVWQGRFIMPPGSYGGIGFEHLPVILCPDAATARAINGSLEKTDDGQWYPHKFQVRIHNWLQKQKTADLSLPLVDLRQLEKEFAAVENSSALLGTWGIFTYINHVLETQNLDPDSDKFGDNLNNTLLAVVHSLDQPFNPYFGKLERRLLIPALQNLLKLQENDTFAAGSSNYSGTDAMNYPAPCQQLATVAAQIVDQEALTLWRDGLRRVADRFSMFRVSCENQSSHWPLAYYYLYQGIGETGYRDLASDFIKQMCLPEYNPFMVTGYQQEAYGPDASYQGLGTCIQAEYYCLSKDQVALQGLRRIFNFFGHTVVPEPDGRLLGATNFSHRTKMSWANAQYGAGAPLLQGLIPVAARMMQREKMPPEPLEKLLQPPADVYKPAVRYATMSFGPYFDSYLYPAQPLSDATLPMQEEDNFTRNFNDEFLAWRRPGFYSLTYFGRTADAWTRSRAKKYPHNPESEKPSNGWAPIQGLAIVWFENYGAFMLNQNWNAYTGQFLRAELPGGRCAYPDYWEHQSQWQEPTLTLQSKLFQAENCHYERRITMLEKGMEQELTVNFAEKCQFNALYEQLPILLKGESPTIEFLVQDNWQAEPGKCRAVRVNKHIRINFAQPQTCLLGPETDLYGVRLACLLIDLGKDFSSEDTVLLKYAIAAE